MKKTLLTFTMGLLFTLSCGKDKKSNYEAMNSEQKKVFSHTLESLGRVTSSADFAHKKQKGIEGARSIDSQSARMGQVLLDGKCDVKFSFPENNSVSIYRASKSQNIEFEVSASGNQCPVSLSYQFKINTDIGHSKGSIDACFKGNYEVKQESYKAYNDIVAFAFNGNMGLKAEKGWMEGSGEVKGALTSVSQGRLELFAKTSGEVKGEFGSANGELISILEVKYPSFTAELKYIEKYENAKSASDKKVEYLLNGESLSPSEFDAYLKRIFSGTSIKKFHGFTGLFSGKYRY